ncbi:unnamed protein product [Rotaria sordida]|uniref:Uncharacterized protein n=1 Tax=Rotaria sordida TaxID=392033 RepID=A0A814IUH6_9BILA|nr:unnamed protein product [Rotaria sordida]CAF1102183.1 unnamed protein product [Rotaria sordida]CAF4091578.1 unnamed protein product [Rotaria sordida]CAF4097236.1 unnamed protein product [Rotaria sordida]
METLFTTCDENDYNVRLTAEESLNKFAKNLKEAVLTRIQVELHGIIKHNPNVEPKALKGARWRFAELANVIHPKKIQSFDQNIMNLFFVFLVDRLMIKKLKTSHALFSEYVIPWLVIARFLMTNAINQLFEHQNQNVSTRIIIGYLDSIKNLMQLLDYSNLFDFDQLLKLTQIGCIEETYVSQILQTVYSTYQR